ncbi:endonuclease/exonuclease/phosphatase family protein [Capnocytophaga sp.]|uniref:endonuclease/exonuclease/phosphatase family protein n=1 Tax=Capnocytophaga sp. TaxID=44737 RepID=UPI0026DCB42D|nr:endonuclease/exonuclease/phosphatase family protein [Capnocytophaga sp.]MDO5104360.1 endonuclease/exonuclease/phosphatase family protein [Capnocytophaga sp.]
MKKYDGLWLFLVLFCFSILKLQAQDRRFMVRTVAFYNVENLFDTINDPHKFDDDRTPEGADRWTSKVYNDHVQKIAKVISEIGSDLTKQAPDVMGLCEVENMSVVSDLINTDYLKKYNYGIVHYDSPDSRGIDVAFIYKKKVFKPTATSKHTLEVYDSDGKRRHTRDQLLVSGMFDGEPMHFIVNHWPSRSGGEAVSRPKREAAAALNKKIIDSLLAKDPNAKIFSMGDFNDDPTNASFKKILKTEGKKEKVKPGGLYNPMEEMLKKGIGSLAYQDGWNLFDQIYFTHELLKDDKSTYRYWKAAVFNKPYLANQKGKYKGYPYRSMSNGNYTWGYSDHFPVYLYLIKEQK